jgi:pyruvate/2-oxoglutarate dehydrogenase complex dihydrolipoamide dehydrogenase (E3) component
MERYDAIIIGSGQAGTPLAFALAEAGRRTALVESKHVGGTCVNEGCTPTKTMVASARVAYLARRGAEYGVVTGPIAVNQAKVRERKRAIVNSFREGSQRRMEQTRGLDLIFGRARFMAARELEVQLSEGGRRQLSADTIFINTGSRAARPPLDGLDDVPFLDNLSIMELDAVPEHLLVLGGGYIGLEFGQMFRRFGSQVTIVHSQSQVLTREDPDVAGEIAKILQQDGIELLLESRATRVSQRQGKLEMRAQTKNGERTLASSHLLVAVGRTPNTDSLNLKDAGIAIDERGFIKTNSRLETNVPGVYALGDVKGGPAFTHISYDDFRIIRSNLLEGKQASIEGRLVPYTVYIDPQLGRVGLTEKEALSRGLKIQIAKMPMTRVARALELDESRGFMKAIIDAETQQVLGAAVLGVEGGEVAALIELAMMGGLPYTALRDGIFAHPTLAESLNNLFQAPSPVVAAGNKERTSPAA